jgi:hypothetical protein
MLASLIVIWIVFLVVMHIIVYTFETFTSVYTLPFCTVNNQGNVQKLGALDWGAPMPPNVDRVSFFVLSDIHFGAIDKSGAIRTAANAPMQGLKDQLALKRNDNPFIIFIGDIFTFKNNDVENRKHMTEMFTAFSDINAVIVPGLGNHDQDIGTDLFRDYVADWAKEKQKAIPNMFVDVDDVFMSWMVGDVFFIHLQLCTNGSKCMNVCHNKLKELKCRSTPAVFLQKQLTYLDSINKPKTPIVILQHDSPEVSWPTSIQLVGRNVLCVIYGSAGGTPSIRNMNGIKYVKVPTFGNFSYFQISKSATTQHMVMRTESWYNNQIDGRFTRPV